MRAPIHPAPSYQRRHFLEQLAGGLVTAQFSTTSAPAQTTTPAVISTKGEPQAEILIGTKVAPLYDWLANELQRYVRLLSGAELPIVRAPHQTRMPTRILIGGPDVNDTTARAQQSKLIDFAQLKADGFQLNTVPLDSQPTVIVGGNSEAATMYAVYDLLERLGIVFQVTGDLIPERRADLIVPQLSVIANPAVKYRGLHIRPIVMPWMGMEGYRLLLDQLAKLKCNYLEFYWYIGAPWTQYSANGEQMLIGDLYTKESCYTTWRHNTATFLPSDVQIGRDHFTQPRYCAEEFQGVNTPEEAVRAARRLLTNVIRYAHERKIQVWLGTGDCPGVPPNLGRSTKQARMAHSIFGVAVPPSDPLGLEIWTAAVDSMITTYPEADGYWVWLAEAYFPSNDVESKRIVARYDSVRKLIPSLNEIKKMGFLPSKGPRSEEGLDSDVALLHYGKELAEFATKHYPAKRFGLAVLGRSYLFRAMDALIPKQVAFSSMESSGVWTALGTTPMELFGGMGSRERFLVPRLDDDASEFGMQFNVGLYHHDRVLQGSVQHGVAGVVPQTGRFRGMEHNAKFIADGAWHSDLTPDGFYVDYATRVFGPAAMPSVIKAFRTLEEHERSLGWRGLFNFLNYGDTNDIAIMRRFRSQERPFDGPTFENWTVTNEVADAAQAADVDARRKLLSPWIQSCENRQSRYAGSIALLEKSAGYLETARPAVLPGSRGELEYLIFKAQTYQGHLKAIRLLLQGYVAYDRAFRSKLRAAKIDMLEEFDRCESLFRAARDQVRGTTEQMAASPFVKDESEKYILFRYNVRFLMPISEFCKFIRNVVNYHHGQPYWEKVDWDVIAPKQWMNP
jgi:hypothetical protein